MAIKEMTKHDLMEILGCSWKAIFFKSASITTAVRCNSRVEEKEAEAVQPFPLHFAHPQQLL